MKTTAVNIRGIPHADIASGEVVYVGRRMPSVPSDGRFGNPHPVGYKCSICRVSHTRETAIEKFREDFQRRIAVDPAYREAIDGLRGKRLACWCKPLACHADVIVSYLES